MVLMVGIGEAENDHNDNSCKELVHEPA
jgi:hypothetical protein